MHILVSAGGILERPEIVEGHRREDGKSKKAERGNPSEEPCRDAKSAGELARRRYSRKEQRCRISHYRERPRDAVESAELPDCALKVESDQCETPDKEGNVGHGFRRHTAKQEQPSAPQKARLSLTGSGLAQAIWWPWPCRLQAEAQPSWQARACWG